MGHLINTFTSPTNTSLSATVKLRFTSLHFTVVLILVLFTLLMFTYITFISFCCQLLMSLYFSHPGCQH